MEQYRTKTGEPPLPTDLCALLQDVETATIGHTEHLGFLSTSLRPVCSAKVIGQALTVAAPGRDGVVIYKAIDLLQPGDVLVISRIDGDDIACVGGGVATAAKARGAAAIIVDGPCTDVEEIVASGLPVWCRGIGKNHEPNIPDWWIHQCSCRLRRHGDPSRFRGARRQLRDFRRRPFTDAQPG